MHIKIDGLTILECREGERFQINMFKHLKMLLHVYEACVANHFYSD